MSIEPNRKSGNETAGSENRRRPYLNRPVVVAVGFCLMLAWHAVGCQQPPSEPFHDYTYTQIHMAMPIRVTVWAKNEPQARSAGHAAFDRIAELVQILSDYEAESELNRLVADQGGKFSGKPRDVSPDLLNVLSYADKIYHLTGGAFDPSAGPVIELWKTARAKKMVPTHSAIESALRRIGYDQLEIDVEHRQIKVLRPDLRLDLGAIAKGYIADQALQAIEELGIESACIEAGGDFVVSDAPPGTNGWEIEVPVLGTMRLNNCGISVSGDTVQFAEIDSIRYSHVVDPRTGNALTNRMMAVVIAPCAMQSDALATSACIMEQDEFGKVVTAMNDVQYWRWEVSASDAPSPAEHE